MKAVGGLAVVSFFAIQIAMGTDGDQIPVSVFAAYVDVLPQIPVWFAAVLGCIAAVLFARFKRFGLSGDRLAVAFIVIAVVVFASMNTFRVDAQLVSSGRLAVFVLVFFVVGFGWGLIARRDDLRSADLPPSSAHTSRLAAEISGCNERAGLPSSLEFAHVVGVAMAKRTRTTPEDDEVFRQAVLGKTYGAAAFQSPRNFVWYLSSRAIYEVMNSGHFRLRPTRVRRLPLETVDLHYEDRLLFVIGHRSWTIRFGDDRESERRAVAFRDAVRSVKHQSFP